MGISAYGPYCHILKLAFPWWYKFTYRHDSKNSFYFFNVAFRLFSFIFPYFFFIYRFGGMWGGGGGWSLTSPISSMKARQTNTIPIQIYKLIVASQNALLLVPIRYKWVNPLPTSMTSVVANSLDLDQDLIWIQTVWLSDVALERFFFKKETY